MRFNDKVVVVTGASQGIGKAAAAAFADEGAKVVIVSIDPENGEAFAKELRANGHSATFKNVDVSSEDAVHALMDETVEQWGHLDILVNNAGIYFQGDVAATKLSNWEQVLAVNLTGAFLCSHFAVPKMRQQGGGVIVNVSSEAGLVGIGGQVAYNVSKAGMVSFTKSCAVDLASDNIRVNCVCPGTTDTPLVQAAVNRSDDPQATRRHLESVRPLDRLGRPEEIASAILYLASDEGGYATGAVLSIDGGYVAQ